MLISKHDKIRWARFLDFFNREKVCCARIESVTCFLIVTTRIGEVETARHHRGNEEEGEASFDGSGVMKTFSELRESDEEVGGEKEEGKGQEASRIISTFVINQEGELDGCGEDDIVYQQDASHERREAEGVREMSSANKDPRREEDEERKGEALEKISYIKEEVETTVDDEVDVQRFNQTEGRECREGKGEREPTDKSVHDKNKRETDTSYKSDAYEEDVGDALTDEVCSTLLNRQEDEIKESGDPSERVDRRDCDA